MSVACQPDTTDPFSRHTIRAAAKRLVADGTFPSSDYEDVVQELHLALFKQADNYDPAKARWSTFVKNVVRLSALSLRRRQRAQCRQGQCELASLNRPIADGDQQFVELGATVSEAEERSGRGQGFVDHVERLEIAIDVRLVVDRMPPELKAVCELLQTDSPTAARRALGVSRTTMDRRLERIARSFQLAGLEPQR